MNPQKQSTAVILPAYNAEFSLKKLLRELLEYIPQENIVVVDDGSKDKTKEVSESAGVTCLRHAQNRGKGSVLVTGLQWARRSGFTWAATMDSDGQHLVKNLESFFAIAVDPAVGILVGKRARKGAMPLHRRASNWISSQMISFLAGQNVYDAQSGFRVYRTELIGHASIPREGRFEWEPQILVLASKMGYGIVPVKIDTVYNSSQSHIRILPDIMRFLKMYWKMAWTV